MVLKSMKMKVKLLSRVRLLVTPWTVAHHAPCQYKLRCGPRAENSNQCLFFKINYNNNVFHSH